MPTVTAIALEALVEPGSSSSPSSLHHLHHHRRHGASHPPSPSHTESRARRHGISIARQKEHGSRPNDGHQVQQPVVVSRGPREAASDISGAPADVVRRHGVQAAGSRERPSANGYYISPKLYETPELTRIMPTCDIFSSSPNSVCSPSPFVVNHKRRDVPRPSHLPLAATGVTASGSGDVASSSSLKLQSQLDGSDFMTNQADRCTEDTLLNGKMKGCRDRHVDDVNERRGRGGERISEATGKAEEEENVLVSESTQRVVGENETNDDEDDDFFDTRDIMSTMSSSDTEDAGSFRRDDSWRCHISLPSQSENCDGPEEYLSDSSFIQTSSSSRASLELELHALRLGLLQEIGRRKEVEESLNHVQDMFQQIARQLSRVGSFCQNGSGWNALYDPDSIAQLCQENVVMRFVSESLESDLARAESELVAEAVINVKNHEIGRLRDRLQYCEAMNQEMSQKNQEASELARRRRLKRKKRRKLIWSCVGLTVAVGASVLACSYLLHGGDSPSLPPNEQRDPPSLRER